MVKSTFFKFSFLVISVIHLASIQSSARRSGGSGGGGGRISSSSGGSFGRSSRWGGGGGGLFGHRGSSGGLGGGFGGTRTASHRAPSHSRWTSTGGFGGGGGGRSYSGGARTSSGGGFGGGGAVARTSYGGGASATRYGSAGTSGSSGRYGGGAATGGAAATRYGTSAGAGGAVRSSGASSPTRYGSGAAIGGGAAAGATRYGGGSYAGAGSSAGRVGAAQPTLTNYGAQRSVSSGGGGAAATRWGSSNPSGGAGRAPTMSGTPMDSMRNRFTGSGGSGGSFRAPQPVAGNARPNYGGYGGGSRPQVHTPAATRSQPTKVVYSTTYNNYAGSRYGTGGFGGGGYGGSSFGGSRSGFGTGSLVATGLAAGVGGYALGRMMGSLSRPYGYGGYGYGGYGGYGYGSSYGGYGMPMGGCGMYGCPSPYTTYVPYRDRYQEYYPQQPAQPTGVAQPGGVDQQNSQDFGAAGSSHTGVATGGQQPTATETPAKNIDLCMLARWNRELAFAEMPNMALDFLANNNVSGNSTSDKAKFMFEFLTVSVDAYEQYNSSADVFAIPAGFDKNTCNIKASKNALTNDANTVQAEEPILTSIRHMLSLYSNKSTNQDNLRDVVDAAKACLPQGPVVTSPEVLGCIDFSLSPDQLLKLDTPHSMFGSSEICRRQLSPDMFKCLPKAAGSPCTLDRLKSLNLFARNFYLCSEAPDDSTPATVSWTSFPATTKSSVIYITTAAPGFWSRLFGG